LIAHTHTGLIVRLSDDVLSSAEVEEKQAINKVYG
jgi:hypothetical protein